MSPPADEPLVSVVVPTYGRDRDHLRDAVESVVAQTHDRVELVVVDDSAEGVRGTVTDVAGDLRVTLCRDGDHDGAGAARNTGIEAAAGPLIAFLDDDDAWDPGKLARQVAAMRADLGVGLVVTGQRYIRDGEVVGRRSPETDGDATEALLRGARLCPFSAAMVRADVVADAGVIDESLPVWEDFEWYLRLSRHCRVAAIDEPLVRRRVGDHEQLTDDVDALRYRAYPRVLEKHRSLAADFGPACERRFRATLACGVAGSAVGRGHGALARRFAWRAVRADPTYLRGYLLLSVALGGRPAYELASRVRTALRSG